MKYSVFIWISHRVTVVIFKIQSAQQHNLFGIQRNIINTYTDNLKCKILIEIEILYNM